MIDRHDMLVAWQFDDDEASCIVFARTALGAARLARLEYGFNGYDRRDMDERVGEMRRASEFDSYAPGPVPMRALLDAGWRYTCSYCEHMVSMEGCDDCAEEYGSGIYEDPVVDDATDEVYCSQACADAEAAERKARSEREESARRRCREALALWPDADLGPFWPTMKEGEGFFHARLPGLKYSVTWEEKDPGHVYVHPDEVAEYQRIRDERRARASVKETKP